MKINIPVRLKNPWFWIGVIGTILTALGVSPEMFTSWQAVWQVVVDLFTNPYQIGCVILALLGVFLDPTSHGLGDSKRALTYTTPNKE